MSGKTGKEADRKNSQLILRLNQTDREIFVELCKQRDTSAAREIRRFIRRYIAKHGGKR